MQGDEQICLIGAGDAHALAQRDEAVIVAGHDNRVTARLQDVPEFQPLGQG